LTSVDGILGTHTLIRMSSIPERGVSGRTGSTTPPMKGVSAVSSTREAPWWARNAASIPTPAPSPG